MLRVLRLLSSDSDSIGRPDKASIPDQILMELLVENLTGKTDFQDKDGLFKDISTWNGVEVSETNTNVETIDFMCQFGCGLFSEEFGIVPGGSIDLQWIPSTVVTFRSPELNLSGTVETQTLPRGLKSLVINQNLFRGSFQVDGLPNTMEVINISENTFTGELGLENLPSSVCAFNAGDNRFSGILDLVCLPVHLEELLLHKNSFSGTINLESLPVDISDIRLEGNSLKQPELKVRSDLKNLSELTLDQGSFETLVWGDGKPIQTPREGQGVVTIHS